MPIRHKLENQPIDLSALTNEGVLALQHYLDHGQRLPAVSSKTSYRDIWCHTRRFQTHRRTTIAGVALRVRAFSRSSKETFSKTVLDLPKDSADRKAFLEKQRQTITTLSDGCLRMQQVCEEFEKDSEGDLARLQEEVSKVRDLTKARERRELLTKSTRSLPVVRLMAGAFKQHSSELAMIQQKLTLFENDGTDSFRHIVTILETGAAGQIMHLA
ncbi:Adenylosuccinate lyase [Mycena indigotica]|uniref:Adenylosuccinate lyase n=1 Tax=Mycena indigotica TaxID=2126181 RepID=A0A8H6SFZ1_9AGAR|nr:Adenylosuccinate lyase [Mycena indigotica]KAF7298699.1 Adenylosuccinate lyase [Mycena indigotica]